MSERDDNDNLGFFQGIRKQRKEEGKWYLGKHTFDKPIESDTSAGRDEIFLREYEALLAEESEEQERYDTNIARSRQDNTESRDARFNQYEKGGFEFGAYTSSENLRIKTPGGPGKWTDTATNANARSDVTDRERQLNSVNAINKLIGNRSDFTYSEGDWVKEGSEWVKEDTSFFGGDSNFRTEADYIHDPLELKKEIFNRLAEYENEFGKDVIQKEFARRTSSSFAKIPYKPSTSEGTWDGMNPGQDIYGKLDHKGKMELWDSMSAAIQFSQDFPDLWSGSEQKGASTVDNIMNELTKPDEYRISDEPLKAGE